MSLIALNEETKIADLIEALKPFAADKDGALVLDTASLKSKTDIENVLNAKNRVKEELKDAKAKLAAYIEKFGDDPDEAKDELETLRANKGSSNQEDTLEIKKNLRAITKERDQFKTQLESQSARIADLDRRELMDRKNSKFENDILKALDPKYDKNKAKTIWGDIRERVNFREDDPNDFNEFEKGKSVSDAIRERLDLYGAYVSTQGGKSSPGNADPQNGNEPKGMFEDAAAQIKF